ncbi:hypothetical protein CASFOL_042353 [Castilleja foliolosa]|uniref:Pentatricopeptide repeat-containing protein n=1 Tax=Castilleja foliolosa TaxID=1961234 RepID=A0ABD3BAI9_9LAMI
MSTSSRRRKFNRFPKLPFLNPHATTSYRKTQRPQQGQALGPPPSLSSSNRVENDFIFLDVLAIIKALGHNKKCELALSVFEWIRKRSDSDKLINGSLVAVIISMLGKDGQVSTAATLFHDLQKDGFDLDVYAYTSLITIVIKRLL